MSEFKVSTQLLQELSAFSGEGTALNEEYTRLETGSLSTLTTSERYLEQHQKIKELIEQYIALVRKDTKDLVDMWRTAQSVDEKLAGQMRK